MVRPVEVAKLTPGGLHIPDDAQSKPVRGTVIAVGTGKFLEDGSVRPLGIEAGDVVMYTKHHGMEIELDGERLLVLRDSEIWGKVTS